MTTVSTPHSANQSTSRCRSVVKVPKLRPAQVCDLHSRQPCAWWPRRRSRPRLHGPPTSYGGPYYSICSDPLPILQLGRKGWAALLINFLNGIAGRRHHSHVRNNPWTMFFCGVHATKKPSAAPFHQEDRS